MKDGTTTDMQQEKNLSTDISDSTELDGGPVS